MLSLADDLRNFTGAAMLRAKSCHSRSSIRHDNLFTILDGAVLFALHAVALDVGHDAQTMGFGTDNERFCSRSHKNSNYYAKRRGSKGKF